MIPNLKGVSRMYEIEFVRGHVEVYLDGAFCFSADTRGEAERELAELTAYAPCGVYRPKK